IARCNRAAREADDLVVALDRRTFGNRACRDLVPGRHEARDRDVLVHQRRPADELASCDDDVVVGMEANRECTARQHGVTPAPRSTIARAMAFRSIAAKSHSMPRPAADGGTA